MNIGQGDEAKWVKMTGQDYLLWDPMWKDCMLRITDDFTQTQTWMFGIPFLQAYYTIHDLDNHTFGLVRTNKDAELNPSAYPQTTTPANPDTQPASSWVPPEHIIPVETDETDFDDVPVYTPPSPTTPTYPAPTYNSVADSKTERRYPDSLCTIY